MRILYNLFCITTFIALYIGNLMAVGNKNLDVSRTGVETVTSQSIGLVLFADVNNTSEDLDFEVVASPDKCCMDINSHFVCNIIEAIGECIETVPKGAAKRLRLVAPLVEPIERRGYCNIHLDSKPRNRPRKVMRNIIKIPFDTRLKNYNQKIEIVDKVTECVGIDEDPLNDCKPIDCESYYNGRRSFYNNRLKRCVSVPVCMSEKKEELPNIIYDVNKNKCVAGDSITKDDLRLIEDLTRSVKDRRTKDILIINKVKKQHKSPSVGKQSANNEVINIPDIDDKIDKTKKLYTSKLASLKHQTFKFILGKYLLGNKCTLIVLVGVIIVQCFLICTLIYCLTKNCKKCRKKKTVKQLFNYRQDASVTTPLICTSNIDTDTTEFQYLSGSSNIDNKIKCYKACQKEGKSNTKKSMSDDILSKLVNRRDWNSNVLRSKIIAESNNFEDESEEVVKEEAINQCLSSAYQKYENNESNKTINLSKRPTVNFENEISNSFKDSNENVTSQYVNEEINNASKTSTHKNVQDEASEKEIKCHSYNYLDTVSNMSGFKPNSKAKRLGFFKSNKKKTRTSLSTEKGAQAAFSNDSIDDFLSERGITFLAGENMSKYSFSSQSTNDPSSMSSEVSEKTSKNNVVKQMLSLLHKKSKQGPSSEPRRQNSLELIHLSKASVYTSSNNESDCFKSIRRPKDSRMSF